MLFGSFNAYFVVYSLYISIKKQKIQKKEEKEEKILLILIKVDKGNRGSAKVDKKSPLRFFVCLELKDSNLNFDIDWEIAARAKQFNPATKKCQLCLTENIL